MAELAVEEIRRIAETDDFAEFGAGTVLALLDEVDRLTEALEAATTCACGCPKDAHIGEIGCGGTCFEFRRDGVSIAEWRESAEAWAEAELRAKADLASMTAERNEVWALQVQTSKKLTRAEADLADEKRRHAELRAGIAADLRAEADRRHAQIEAGWLDAGIDPTRHWHKHDDGCASCAYAQAAQWVLDTATEETP